MEKVTDANWEQDVLQSDIPVAIDFGATWCGPCKKLDPIMEQLAVEYDGRVKIRKVDVGEAPQVAQRYKVLSVPRVLFFKNGEVHDQVNGLLAKDKLAEKLDRLLEG